MLRLSFNLVGRRFKAAPLYASFITGCLALGFTCVLFVTQWIRFELSYDKFHKNHDNIYRLTVEKNDPTTGYHTHFARSWYGWLKHIKESVPGIEKHARITHLYGGIVKAEKNIFETKLFYTTSEVFDVFTFEFISGSPDKALSDPFTLVVTKSSALKYFGSLHVIGESLKVYCRNCSEKKEYTIVGVIEDMPENSHFKFDILAAYEDTDQYSGWAYHYLLLSPETRPNEITSAFPVFASKHLSEEEVVTLTPSLQNITGIHLRSDKAREFEPNGDVRDVYMLGVLGLIVFGVAIFNFVNLQFVQVLKKSKTFQVFRFNGSQKNGLYVIQLTESAIYSLIAVIVGFIIFEIGQYFMQDQIAAMSETLACPWYIIPLLFILATLAGITPIYPLLRRQTSRSKRMLTPLGDRSSFRDKKLLGISRLLVAIQYSATIMLLIFVIVIHRQIDFFMQNRLGHQDENIINLTNMPAQVVDKYQVFKENLLSHPAIKGVTSSMEDPADESMDMMAFETSGVKDALEEKQLSVYPVDDNFFQFYDVNVMAGRNFHPFDGTNKSAETYVLNESAVKLLGWTPQEAIGKPFTLKFFINDTNLFNGGHIVGVVEDFQMASMKNKIKPFVFFQKSFWLFSTQVKYSEGNLASAIEHIEQTWSDIYSDFPLEYSLVEDLYKNLYQNEIQLKNMSIWLGIIAVLLSGFGLIGTTGIFLETKTKEMGIRKVNGATSKNLLLTFFENHSIWLLVAFASAVPIAWLSISTWLQNFAYQVPLNWWIFMLSGLIVFSITIITIGWQSWRAANKNPVLCLRHE
jgi:putative ABC transport system permease protein